MPADNEEGFMTVSRRRFLKAGTISAFFASALLKGPFITVARGLHGGDMVGNPFDPMVDIASDPLSYYTQSTFEQYVNSIFRLHGSTTFDVTLAKVTDLLPANATRESGRECFSLLFLGDPEAVSQATYTVEHGALGTFRLFLVPAGLEDPGKQGNLAIINRLSWSKDAGKWRGKAIDKRTGNLKTERSLSSPATTLLINKGAATTNAPLRRGKPSQTEDAREDSLFRWLIDQ